MKREYLPVLCCPHCKSELSVTVTSELDNDIREGTLNCASCGAAYPVRNGIPDFVTHEEPPVLH